MGCTHLLASMNDAAINIHVQAFMKSRYQRVEILGQIVIVYLFIKQPNHFLKWMHSFTFLPAVYEGGSDFSTP